MLFLGCILFVVLFESALGAMTQTLTDRGGVECGMKDVTMMEVFNDADEPWYLYNVGGFWLSSWILAGYSANQGSRSPDHTVFYVRSGVWYIYDLSEVSIGSTYTYTDSATGSKACALASDQSAYVYPGPVYHGGACLECALSDDGTELMVIGTGGELFRNTGGVMWELLDDTLVMQFIDYTRPSNADWVVGVSDDSRLYVLRYPCAPHSPEWKEIPVTGDSNGGSYRAMSVSKDGWICFISNTATSGGHFAMYGQLFSWTCDGIAAHTQIACGGNGVCVEEGVCDCYAGYESCEETCVLVGECPSDEVYDDDFFQLVDGNTTDVERHGVYECDTDSASVSSRKDAAGFYYQNSRMYIFGGYGIDQYDDEGYLNDVWSFNEESKLWCFIKGNQTSNQPHNVLEGGLPLTYAQTNEPSSRSGMSSFSTIFTFVVFGGELSSDLDTTNEMWEFSVIGTEERHQWRMLMEGSEVEYSQDQQPSKRGYGCMSHFGFSADTVFLFGGKKWNNETLEFDHYNDLWSYSILINEFTKLQNGSNNDTFSILEPYAVENFFNKLDGSEDTYVPPRRSNCVCWSDDGTNPNFYVFGGEFPNMYATNDMWVFNTTSLNWIFVAGGTGDSGNQVAVDLGYYNFDSQNIPASRSDSVYFMNQMYFSRNSGLDLENSFLFFGGMNSRSGQVFADMWSFSSSLNQFKFMNGSLSSGITRVNDDFIGSRSSGVGILKPNYGALIFGGSTLR